MPLADAFRYIDEMALLSTKDDGFSVYFSGGEPFLRYHDLLVVTRHAKEKGATQVSCITNGFWGKNITMARKWVTELCDSGMTQVCFSLDDFHQEHIPLRSVLSALATCREAGLCFAIKCAVTRNTRRLPEILSDLGNLLLDTYVPIQELAYVPQTEAGNMIPKDEWLLQEYIPNEPCQELIILSILPNGTAFPCCGSGWTNRLIVGNAQVEPISNLMRKVSGGSLFVSLRDKGPAFFVPYFKQAGYPLPLEGYVNRCHLCRTVLSHRESERILRLALTDLQ